MAERLLVVEDSRAMAKVIEQLGKSLGVSGTPAILLEDGTLIPGYRPAADLIKELAN